MDDDNNTEVNEDVIRRLDVRGLPMGVQYTLMSKSERLAAKNAVGTQMVAEDGVQFVIPMETVIRLVEKVYGYLLEKLIIVGWEDYERRHVLTVPDEDAFYLNYRLRPRDSSGEDKPSEDPPGKEVS